MFGSSRFFALVGVLAFSLCTAPASHAAYAAYEDPPGRVARLTDSLGEISYSPAGEDQWINIVRNRPLISGDRIWTDRNARAEFQVGSAAMRLGPYTSVEILDLDDQVAQIQLTQGTLNLRVRRLYSGQIFEVDTPTLAFTINQAGSYRIDVDPDNDQTTIVVRQGAGVAYGENSRFPLRAGDTVRFYQADLNDHDMYGLPRADAFDRYCLDRDQRLDRSTSLRYVDDDVIGYADLDQYGSWRSVNNYGNVWFPSRVDANWAPYRDGRWVWQEPWGWTWVDDAPWGFAPSHYGRWAHVSNRWGWIPGPRHARAVYAPALVVFIGGRGWSISLSQGRSSSVGWFPLGPRDVYVPSYRASRDYFSRVNVNNTVVNNTIINNVYNNYATGNINVAQANYANRTVAGAATAVPSTVFVNSQSVRQASTRLDRNVIASGEITRVAPIAPNARSVLGRGVAARTRPSREIAERQVFARNVPPPGELPFATRERQLRQNPGQALVAPMPQPTQGRAAQRNVRVITEQREAINVREARSRREAGMPAARARPPAQLQPLDRSAEPMKQPRIARERQAQMQQQQIQQQRQAQLQQQQIQQQRQTEIQQKQAEEKQRTEREQQAAEQQRGERDRQAQMQRQAEQQRQAQLRQQQIQQQRQTEIQRKQAEEKQRAEQEQRNAEQQRGERERQIQMQQERQAQLQQQQIQQQRQAEIQRKQAEEKQRAEQEQRNAEQQRGERERQIQMQQQRQAQLQQQQIQQQRKQAEEKQRAEQEQQAAEQQRGERERQIQMQQQRQAQLQQQQIRQQRQAEIQQKQAEERQRAEQEQQAAEQQRGERERQIQIQQQRQAQLQQRQVLIEQQQMQAERERQAQAREQPPPAAQRQVACQASDKAPPKGKRDNRTGRKDVACEKQE